MRNGGSRGFGMDDDDEDEDDNSMKTGAQRVILKEDSITFDQVCFIDVGLFL